MQFIVEHICGHEVSHNFYGNTGDMEAQASALADQLCTKCVEQAKTAVKPEAEPTAPPATKAKAEPAQKPKTEPATPQPAAKDFAQEEIAWPAESTKKAEA